MYTLTWEELQTLTEVLYQWLDSRSEETPFKQDVQELYDKLSEPLEK